jgi:hypothetical protein
VPDPIYFNTSCKVTLQQIGGEQTEFVRRLKKQGAVLRPVSVAGEKQFYKLFEMSPVPDISDPTFPSGWTNYYRQDDVSATAYFYLDKPVNALPPIAPVALRAKDVLKKVP